MSQNPQCESGSTPLPHPTFSNVKGPDGPRSYADLLTSPYPHPKEEDVEYLRTRPATTRIGSFSIFEVVTTALLIDRDTALKHPRHAFRQALEYLAKAPPVLESLLVEMGESEVSAAMDLAIGEIVADEEKLSKGEIAGFLELSDPVEKSRFVEFVRKCDPKSSLLEGKTTNKFVNALERHGIWHGKQAKLYYAKQNDVRRLVELESKRIAEENKEAKKRSRSRNEKSSKRKTA
jgi:hypothetical protein